VPGKFEVKQSASGTYFFNLLAGNGQVVMTSEMYQAKASALKAIESVRKNAPMDERYARKESHNGKFYFVLKAGNHQVIGQSQMYTTLAARDAGMSSVRSNSPDAVVSDLTS